tara:strand:+ start:568 stop:1017 length:450 start_codon:yes stop_codon:yes gene_type:complete
MDNINFLVTITGYYGLVGLYFLFLLFTGGSVLKILNSRFFVQGNGLRIFLFIELLLWAFACLYGYYNENIFIFVVAVLFIIFGYIPVIFNSNYQNKIIREWSQTYKDPSLTRKETDVLLTSVSFALYLFVFLMLYFSKTINSWVQNIIN